MSQPPIMELHLQRANGQWRLMRRWGDGLPVLVAEGSRANMRRRMAREIARAEAGGFDVRGVTHEECSSDDLA